MIESNLEFNFGTANVEQVADNELGHGLKNVDFLVRENKRTLLIEVKATSSSRWEFWSDAKINELVEKARDTYTYLHLIGDDALPLDYIVLIDLKGQRKSEQPLIIRRYEKLIAGLKGEKGHKWAFNYVRSAVVLGFEEFADFLPQYTVNRYSRLP